MMQLLEEPGSMVPGQSVLEQLPKELQTSQSPMVTVVQSMSGAADAVAHPIGVKFAALPGRWNRA
jgi:hypothetical protein